MTKQITTPKENDPVTTLLEQLNDLDIHFQKAIEKITDIVALNDGTVSTIISHLDKIDKTPIFAKTMLFEKIAFKVLRLFKEIRPSEISDQVNYFIKYFSGFQNTIKRLKMVYPTLENCDIAILLGRHPKTKAPHLYFIGRHQKVKLFEKLVKIDKK